MELRPSWRVGRGCVGWAGIAGGGGGSAARLGLTWRPRRQARARALRPLGLALPPRPAQVLRSALGSGAGRGDPGRFAAARAMGSSSFRRPERDHAFVPTGRAVRYF